MAECLLGRLKERAVLPGAAESCPVPVHLSETWRWGRGCPALYTRVSGEKLHGG